MEAEADSGGLLARTSRALLSGGEGGHPFTFYQVLILVGFLSAIWAVTALLKRTFMPPLLGHILVGIIMGPEVLNVFEEPLRQGVIAMIGELGLWLLVLYAGLEIDTHMLLQIGGSALAIAVTGVAGSVGFAMAVGFALGMEATAATAAAIVIAPSSLAVVSAVLSGAGMMNNPTGQQLVTAAAYDDVIALVLLSELAALVEPDVETILVPIVSAAVAVAVLGYLAIFKVPHWLAKYVLPRIPEQHVESFTICLMFSTAVGLATLLQAVKASQYLGIFLTGVTFSSLDSMEHIWHHKVKPVADWVIAIFFAATVGFEIPIRAFGNASTVLKGLAFFGGVFGKLLTGIWAKPRRTEWYKVGLAMMAMGEFSFVIGVEARSLGLLSEDQEAEILLATLLAIIFPPVILAFALQRSERKLASRLAEATKAVDEDGGASNEHVYYRFNMRVVSRPALLDAVLSKLHAWKMEILDVRVKYEGALTVVEAYAQDDGLLIDRNDPESAASQLGGRVKGLLESFAAVIAHDPRAEAGTASAALRTEQRQRALLNVLTAEAEAAGKKAPWGTWPVTLPLSDVELDELLVDLRGVSLVRWLPLPDDEEEDDEFDVHGEPGARRDGTGPGADKAHGVTSTTSLLRRASMRYGRRSVDGPRQPVPPPQQHSTLGIPATKSGKQPAAAPDLPADLKDKPWEEIALALVGQLTAEQEGGGQGAAPVPPGGEDAGARASLQLSRMSAPLAGISQVHQDAVGALLDLPAGQDGMRTAYRIAADLYYQNARNREQERRDAAARENRRMNDMAGPVRKGQTIKRMSQGMRNTAYMRRSSAADEEVVPPTSTPGQIPSGTAGNSLQNAAAQGGAHRPNLSRPSLRTRGARSRVARWVGAQLGSTGSALPRTLEEGAPTTQHAEGATEQQAAMEVKDSSESSPPSAKDGKDGAGDGNRV
ncbi:unnamed protein product [Pedinophyceae sp. YPF-701]|nr:unnamed protein product [Pedinophyceae sp. YPF-701]